MIKTGSVGFAYYALTFLLVVTLAIFTIKCYCNQPIIVFSNYKNAAKFYDRFRNTLKNKVQTIPECDCQRELLYPPLEGNPIIFDSSCSDEGTLYRDGQKVVTFSMYFKNKNDTTRMKLYNEGIRVNLERMNQFYPDYSMRVYTNEPLAGEYCSLVCNNPELFWCDIADTPSLGNQSGIYFAAWRFLTLGDPTVDIFLSRDLDSAITEREVAVVRDWFQLDKAIHLMRDKQGNHDIPILAGMWGARNGLLRGDAETMRAEIINLTGVKKRYRELDQHVLNKVIFYPRKTDIVAYDSYNCKKWSKETLVRPFPRRRENNSSDFVGNLELGRKTYKLDRCPEECRPNYGKDWEYC